jgi:hypothetical protein
MSLRFWFVSGADWKSVKLISTSAAKTASCRQADWRGAGRLENCARGGGAAGGDCSAGQWIVAVDQHLVELAGRVPVWQARGVFGLLILEYWNTGIGLPLESTLWSTLSSTISVPDGFVGGVPWFPFGVKASVCCTGVTDASEPDPVRKVRWVPSLGVALLGEPWIGVASLPTQLECS